MIRGCAPHSAIRGTSAATSTGGGVNTPLRIEVVVEVPRSAERPAQLAAAVRSHESW
jgi:hypothetical protein